MKSKTNWELLRKMKDSDIDCSDIEETDEKFWADAEDVYPTVNLSLKIDSDIANWINSFGDKSNIVINNILRSHYFTYNQMQKL